MLLSLEDRKNLRKLLTEYVPQTMIASVVTEAGLPVGFLNLSHPPAVVWLDVLKEAERHGLAQLLKLLETAAEWAPGAAETLEQTASRYARAGALGHPVSAASRDTRAIAPARSSSEALSPKAVLADTRAVSSGWMARSSEAPSPAGAGAASSPESELKVMIVAASPIDQDRLRLDQEVRDIEEGLNASPLRERFRVKHLWAARTRDLHRAMVEWQPHFVHFTAPGAGRVGICLEDAQGNTQVLSDEALAALFELTASHVRCVLLNACYSTSQVTAIAAHIDHVIGMSAAMPDRAAIEFAVAFYSTLGSGKDVEFAFRAARVAVQMAGVSGNQVPILRTRSQSEVTRANTAPLIAALPLPDKRTLEMARPTNLNFERTSSCNWPVGWGASLEYVRKVSADYTIQVVDRPTGEPGRCVLLAKSDASTSEFGSVMQRCEAAGLTGRPLRIQAEIMSKEVELWAGLWLRIDDTDGSTSFFENMNKRPIRGTSAWNRYAINAEISQNAAKLNYGVVLAGRGSVWVSNVRIFVWEHDHWRDV